MYSKVPVLPCVTGDPLLIGKRAYSKFIFGQEMRFVTRVIRFVANEILPLLCAAFRTISNRSESDV
jgi:hypothetical protein